MTRLVKIGVLGCAAIADRFMIPAVKGLSGNYALAGVASRDRSKAEQFSSRFDTEAFCGYDSLLQSGKLDAVYLPLPNSMHREWIEKALHRNLHVLVEKSLSCSYDDARYLNELAQKRGLVLVENFQFRFHSQLATIRRMVDDGVIGELRCLRSSFGFPPFPDAENIRYRKELGGGALLDAGAYPVKMAQYFLGLDLTVEAANLAFQPDREVDIWGGAYLKQKSGTGFAEIAFGFDHFYQCSLELWGSKGRILANRIFTSPPGYASELTVETASGSELVKLEPDNHFQKMLLHFHTLVTTGTGVDDEYSQNVSQARLIDNLRGIANGKR